MSGSKVKVHVYCEWPDVGPKKYDAEDWDNEPKAGDTILLRLKRSPDEKPSLAEFKVIKVVLLNGPPDSTTGPIPFGFIQREIEVHVEPVV